MKKLFIFFLIGIITAAIGIYIRCFPVLFSQDHEAREKASVLIIGQIRQYLRGQIQKEYPQLPAAELDLATKKALDEYLAKEKKTVRSKIDDAAGQISPRRGYPYLLASDSYYYYDLSRNILDSGTLGAEEKGSKFLYTKMASPHGHWEPRNLHPFLGVFVYKILSTVNPGISLMQAARILPLIIMIVSLIIFLRIGHIMEFHPSVLLTTSIFFVLAPAFVKRSAIGWYDNDPYNILFFSLLMSVLFLFLRSLDQPKKTWGFSLLMAVIMTTYSLFWHGWMFIFISLILSLGFCGLWIKFQTKQSPKTNSIWSAGSLFIITALAGISLIFGPKEIIILFREGLAALRNFSQGQLSLWPNIYISVAELKRASLNFIIAQSGGLFFMSLAVAGTVRGILRLFRTSLQKTTDDDHQNLLFICIITFAVLSVLLTLKAERFALLCVLPLSLLCGLGLQWIWDTAQFFIHKIPTTSKRLSPATVSRSLLVTIILFLSVLPIYKMSLASPLLMNFIFNETWERALVKIKAETPPESIVYCWWPPGHFIKAIADRRVIFDGATINVPQAYWMANIFLSSSEEEALGYIRMLNSDGNGAVSFLTDQMGIPTSKAVKIIKQITPLAKDTAAQVLFHTLKNPVIGQEILSRTHKEPSPSYILLYNEFVENNLQLGFFGKWDFEKIEQINQNPSLLKKIPQPGSPDHIPFLWQLAGGPYRYSGPLLQISQKDDIIFFDQNVQADIKNLSVEVNSLKFGKGTPFSIFYFDATKQRVLEKILPQSNLHYSAVLTQDNGRWTCLLLERPLAQSLLIRLYFFKAKGLKYFKLFDEQSDLTSRTEIKTFAIDWKNFKGKDLLQKPEH